jgi:DNA-binding transcriptional MerR regulator
VTGTLDHAGSGMNTALLSEKEYFSIGEAGALTQVEPFVLRYWENEFKLLRPSRRESGHRKYSRKDIETILKIKNLLHVRGFTIEGAKKRLLEEGRTKPEQLKIELEDTSAAVQLLQQTKQTLEEILEILV